MKLTEFKASSEVDSPVYFFKPFVVLSDENVVLFAGSESQVRKLSSYFDNCEVEVRRHDLHMNDNTRII